MAHELHTDELSGEVAMFSAGEVCWHGLGTVTSGALTWSEAIKTAHLDWEVEKRQLRSDRGDLIPAYGNFRVDTNKFLGVVGSKYCAIQNIQMGESLDMIIGNINGAHYETAGALGNGERVWAMAKLPEQIRLGNDISENYILFSNTHDGSASAQVKLTSTRVVCSNTLSMSLRGSGSFFKIAHYASADRKIEEVARTIGNMTTQIKNLNVLFGELANKQISSEEWSLFLKTIVPVTLNKNGVETTNGKNKRELITSIFESNDNNAFPEQKGTYFNALNAVTNYVDHHSSVKGDAEVSRGQSALFGAGEALKFFALTELSRMIGIEKSQLSDIL